MKAEKKMEKIYSDLDFTSKEDYFNYCVESHINGNFTQCKKLFQELPKQYKHELINFIRDNYGNDKVHNYYVSLF